ncbi:hypothetical protein B0I72DRAFT_142446 [Yarrowia lipolytica]|uniref:YALI0E33429p n=2 Tax=Yarrowia lipolytica TaxID=4952 RepID=Q6C3N2_YARLI|nr:YALI0E33429p [Yarrowia lipolytica CLIB122]AOW06339.1 hypothetical protein YALI1_E39579g [Yarrowia lipolytica]KAB8279878.1 hypothetical protein BKA91DRAFT_176259 [Yarrowia lipolytica]KAE8171208.1 hypothetical protein BKA90DRAFT_175223 [Yarrowia lipolytica]KAJ8057710.1 hypothetical protein LXG23DRAFT_14434 [Yarrowia lipolytica]RDW23156.1 hypothetical protein B0I71DRAFT_161352 [Yarrowia lipolytica]|eukprot:XP_504730.1 YALI0E33429p [Yarrowia lipolytica CLIB122]
MLRAVSRVTPRNTRRFAPCVLNGPNSFQHKHPGLPASRPFLSFLLGSLMSPVDAIKNLRDTKTLLEQTKDELLDTYEQTQIPRVHTFSPPPGYFPRKNEMATLQRALSTDPAFVCMFGGSSVGKTALLRKVLSGQTSPDQNMIMGGWGVGNTVGGPSMSEHEQHKFVVIHFDLRIAGFSDRVGLYIRLAAAMEGFFQEVVDEYQRDGVGEEAKKEYEKYFKGHILTFKHARKDMEQKLEDAFKSASGRTREEACLSGDIAKLMEMFQSSMLSYWEFDPHKILKEREKIQDKAMQQVKDNGGKLALKMLDQDELLRKTKDEIARRSGLTMGSKRVPVFIFDEAHRLPTLIDDEDCLKTLLDSFLVLTKQDRLCHVIQCTSDAFYMLWLRAINVSQHSKIITIDDATYEETRKFWHDSLLASTVSKTQSPGLLKNKLPDFDVVWDFFGGRFAYITDFVAEFINAQGEINPYNSSSFVHSYTLLNLFLTHQSFDTYSSLPESIDFTVDMDPEVLLSVCVQILRNKYNSEDPQRTRGSINYFDSCALYGTEHVNALVKSRILNINWTEPVGDRLSNEGPQLTPECIYRPQLQPMSRVVEKAMEVVLASPALTEVKAKAKERFPEIVGDYSGSNISTEIRATPNPSKSSDLDKSK